MDLYPHPSLWINGRFVSIGRIVSGMQNPVSEFEGSTFGFIREWLTGRDHFALTTSGSTGTPKKIILTRSQMTASARLTGQALGLTEGQTTLVCIDTKFIGGRMMLVRALTLGLRIIAVDPTANPLEKIPVDQWVNFAAFVPYQVEFLLESKRPHLLERVDRAIIGGAPLRASTVEKLQTIPGEFFETYGMTETVSHVALRQLNGGNRQKHFTTLPGITIDLDTRGCLILDVPFLDEKVVTNDLALMHSSQTFTWTGRYDNIINTGGIKVAPEKIESAVERFNAAGGYKLRFFVHGIEDSLLGSKVVLVIEANTIDEEFLSSLHTYLTAELSTYEIPREALLVSEFRTTENGKINRLQTVKGFHTTLRLKK